MEAPHATDRPVCAPCRTLTEYSDIQFAFESWVSEQHMGIDLIEFPFQAIPRYRSGKTQALWSAYLAGFDSRDHHRVTQAAPELLEALRTLVPSDEQEAGWWCRQCVAETGATNDERCVSCGEPFGDPHEAEAIRAARAAIAKAEGNQ